MYTVKTISKYICLLLFIFFQSCGQKDKLSVVVNNYSNVTVENIHIKYTGGDFQITKLLPGRSFSREITPQGESSLSIELLYAGKTMKHECCYFERTYSGYILFKIY